MAQPHARSPRADVRRGGCRAADRAAFARQSPAVTTLHRQEEENALVAAALKKKLTLEFHGESLKQAIAVLETKSDDENFFSTRPLDSRGAAVPRRR